LVLSIGLNAIISYLLFYGNRKFTTIYITCGVILNLGILAFFKYAGLILGTFTPIAFQNEPLVKVLMHLPLPIGISFFTFEGISLVVDAYRKRDEPTQWGNRNFFKYFLNSSLFISFFPHLIAGPILKANQFIPQIQEKSFSAINWEKAFKSLVIGYFLKMVIADNLKEQTLFLSVPFDGLHPIDLLSMLFGYSIQIFADFAGYSLIAIGLAELLGYQLIQNFNFPYLSQSFSEFWQRWHISLSTWLKEYLYIPLGGNRKGNLRTYFNLFMVMFLGGLWHGAAWSYAIWGTVHGFALMGERFLGNYIHLPKNKLFSLFKIVLVFTVVTFAWLFFKLPNIADVAAFYKALTIWNSSYNLQFREVYIFIYSLPVLVYYLIYYFKSKNY
jgi:alginate O-acetyltransferase complex protein AlgI